MKYLLSMLLVLICFSKSSYSQELSETDKLFATCKVWGYLKYYHPKVAAGKFDFDRKLFELLSQIENSSSKEEFSRTLTDWIITFGKIKSNPKSPNENYFDKNFNLEWTKNEQCFSPELTEIFKDIENNRHQGKKHYVSAHQTSGYAIMTNEAEDNDLNWESKEYRLLCLFRYWNFVEYFFPYKYQTDTDWDSVLMESIPEFLEAKTETEYHLAILSLVASVDDSHASFITKQTFNYFGNKFVPFNTSIINGKAIVTELLDEALCEENDIRKVRYLQQRLFQSPFAKLIAVQEVTTLNKNKQIP
ncbi:MAG: hypothetical protein R3279_05155, partial [Putridiphycobacter sp.]|nr:hypothetical protein [Putridiphycobacter sp.]